MVTYNSIEDDWGALLAAGGTLEEIGSRYKYRIDVSTLSAYQRINLSAELVGGHEL